MLDRFGASRCEVKRKKKPATCAGFCSLWAERGLCLAAVFGLLSLNRCQCHGIDNIVNQGAT